MEMVWCGRSAFGPVVEHRPAGPEIGQEPKESRNYFRDGLGSMLQMGDGEVGGENRAGIAENQVFVSVKNPFLGFREIPQT
jgi:hypothetical protein